MTSREEKSKSLTGQLLIADPALKGIFHRSVILLTEHHKEDGGVRGIILNRPTRKKASELLGSEKFEKAKNIPVYLGGPVEQKSMSFALFTLSEAGNFSCLNEIPIREALSSGAQSGKMVLAFTGHSAWSAGQLEAELQENAWVLCPPHPEIFTHWKNKTEEKLWRRLLQKLSPYHHLMSQIPEDIFLN